MDPECGHSLKTCHMGTCLVDSHAELPEEFKIEREHEEAIDRAKAKYHLAVQVADGVLDAAIATADDYRTRRLSWLRREQHRAARKIVTS